MGGETVIGIPPPPGGGPPGPVDLTQVVSLLQQIRDLLNGVIGLGQSIGTIEVMTCTAGGTAQALYPSNKKIKKGILMNLDESDPVTIFSSGSNAVGIPSAAGTGNGMILNLPPADGQGGGSFPVGNIDLGTFSWIAATTGDLLAVYYET